MDMFWELRRSYFVTVHCAHNLLLNRRMKLHGYHKMRVRCICFSVKLDVIGINWTYEICNQVDAFFTCTMVQQGWEHLFREFQNKNVDILDFTVLENVQFVTRVAQSQFMPSTRRNVQTTYQNTLCAPLSILRWVQTSNNPGSSESRTRHGRSQVSEQTLWTVQFLLPPPPEIVPKDTNCRIKDSLIHYTEHLGKAISDIYVREKRRTSVSSMSLCSKIGHLSFVYGQHVFGFKFFTSDLFFRWMCHSHLRIDEDSEHSELGHRKQIAIWQDELYKEKVIVWYTA